MYRYRRFGTVELPDGNVRQKISSMGTANSLVTVAGGAVFDHLGSDDAPSKPGTVTLTANLRGNGRAALETSYRELLALRGKVAKLYRAWDASGRVELIDARLMSVDTNADYWHNNVLTAVQAKWQLLDNVWNGDAHEPWYFDSGEYFDTGLDFDNIGLTMVLSPPDCSSISCTHGFTVVNNGNQNVTSATMKLASSNPLEITGDMVIKSPHPWERTHIILNESIVNRMKPHIEEIVINSGNSSVSMRDSSGNDTDAYHGFSLGEDQAVDEWISLEPGDNHFLLSYTKTLTFTTPTIIIVVFEFADAHQ